MGDRVVARFAALAVLGLVACSSAAGPAVAGSAFSPKATAAPAASPSPSPLPTPRPTQRILDVKIHYQQHRLTCEAAALEMALSYLGVDVDELTLISYMTRDNRPAQVDGGRLVRWGDPARGFVGDPDGHLENYTGYGVYYLPVARAAVFAGVHVVMADSGLYGSGVAPSDVYNAVLDGRPVVAWISNTYHQVRLSSYTAYDGATVWYTLTEHAVTVVGVRPDAVLINDPYFGPAWRPKAQFESAYATFSNMAVVLEK